MNIDIGRNLLPVLPSFRPRRVAAGEVLLQDARDGSHRQYILHLLSGAFQTGSMKRNVFSVTLLHVSLTLSVGSPGPIRVEKRLQ